MNYEKDIKIDETALDIEWLSQPGLMMQYTRYQAGLQLDEDKEKENLEFITAELDKEIRTNPEKFGIEKITEGVVRNTILLEDKYKEANKGYLTARFENNVGKGAVRSVDGRKTALENLVKLHGQQYFAGPKVPRDISKEWEWREQQKQSDIGVARKLKAAKAIGYSGPIKVKRTK